MNTTRTRSLVVALVAMAGLVACGQEDTASDTAPSTTEPSASTQDSSAPETGVELSVDSAAAGKCAVPSPETLATFDTAFEGTVTSLADGTATLTVDQWYAGGDDAASVTVTTPSEDLTDLLMAVDFQADQTYLVSATGGRVSLCGFTGEKTAELEALYQAAYAG